MTPKAPQPATFIASQSRTYAGHGIGAQLVDHTADLVADSQRRWLRLDCAKNNTRLHDYYRQLGFTHVGSVDLPHRKSGALFQRPSSHDVAD